MIQTSGQSLPSRRSLNPQHDLSPAPLWWCSFRPGRPVAADGSESMFGMLSPVPPPTDPFPLSAFRVCGFRDTAHIRTKSPPFP